MSFCRYIFLFSFTLILINPTGRTAPISPSNNISDYLVGNSWMIAGGYNHSFSSEFNFNIGRTRGYQYAGSGKYFSATSYGIGYSILPFQNDPRQLGEFFVEHSFMQTTRHLPFGLGARLSYLYDFGSQDHYIRTSAGYSLVFADIFYNYSFALSGNNHFYHGITLRLKGFLFTRGWIQENSGVNPF